MKDSQKEIENSIIFTQKVFLIIDILRNVSNIKTFFKTNNNYFEDFKKGQNVFIRNEFKLDNVYYLPYEYTNVSNNLECRNPFHIPIKLNRKMNYDEGRCNYKYLDDKQIVFSDIEITNKLSNLTPSIYAHEIVHIIQEDKKVVNNSCNNEVLPLFFDKLVLFDDKDAYNNNQIQRLKMLYKSLIYILNNEYISKDILIGTISLFKAFNLFDKYCIGSNNDKLIMKEDIQKIFSGDMLVDDFLIKNDVTFQNSQDVNLIKKLSI